MTTVEDYNAAVRRIHELLDEKIELSKELDEALDTIQGLQIRLTEAQCNRYMWEEYEQGHKLLAPLFFKHRREWTLDLIKRARTEILQLRRKTNKEK